MLSDTNHRDRRRIVVVDDEPEIVAFCKLVLERLGYSVSTLTDPQRALQLVAERDLDLLITDVRMPTMGGLELIEAARKHKPDLVSVVITGCAYAVETVIRALRVGATDFVAKPFTIKELQRAVEHALDNAEAIREHARLLTLMPLLSLGQSGVTTHDTEALLSTSLQIARDTLQGETACFYRWRAEQERFELIHPHRSHNLPLPEAEVFADQIRASSQAFVLPCHGTEADPAFQTSTQAIAPVIAPDGLIGALLIIRPDQQPPFGRSDLETLTVMAHQIAALYENTRLVQELQSWTQQLEARVQGATDEPRRTQERLIRAERLAAIGELGAGIAHELRTPLGVINNSVYYLKSYIPDADPKARRHLDIIENEVDLSSEIITDLMSFARVQQIEMRANDPNELVRAALARASVPPTVSVRVQFRTNGARVQADADRFCQVLANLMTKAVQAMPDGGDLMLTTRAESDHVVFEIADTGRGIPKDQLDRIFEPLFTTKARGVGMGLAIVRMLVEAHQGTIQVDSKMEHGSRFIVRMPRAKQDASS